MKRIYVKEEWCLGCHLCEYNCAFANSGAMDMAEALKGKPIFPRIHIEEGEKICYAVSCRHCTDPICIKSCIAGAISKIDGVVVLTRTNALDALPAFWSVHMEHWRQIKMESCKNVNFALPTPAGNLPV